MMRRGPLSVATYWAGAAHPRRQKQREMPPPGASEPAFAATVEPASTQITSDLPTARRIYKRVLGDGLKKAEGGLLPASILDFRPRLGNRCKLFPVYTLFRASILDFKPKLGNRCSVIAAAVRNGPPATSVAAKRFSVRF